MMCKQENPVFLTKRKGNIPKIMENCYKLRIILHQTQYRIIFIKNNDL